MSYKTILVPAQHSASAASAIQFAAELANAHAAHLVGVASTGINQFISQTQLYPAGLPVQIGDLGFLRERADQALAEFDAAARRQGVRSFETRRVDDNIDDGLILHARYGDLVVIGQADPDQQPPAEPPGLAQRVMLHTARPVLIVPYAGRAEPAARHALVAWNGSMEATRAVTAAIPLLRRAAKVTLAVLNPFAQYQVHGEQPGADLALYLARHDIAIEIRQQDTPFDVGNELLSMAADINADLLVMGGYGHARLLEMALGGVTRTILNSMTLPVLMAH